MRVFPLGSLCVPDNIIAFKSDGLSAKYSHIESSGSDMYAMRKYDELCIPYAAVIDIDKSKLPSVETAKAWTPEQFAKALRNDQACPDYNLSLRQLLHVGYKIAAFMGDEFLDALKKHEHIIAKNVTENILERHIKPLFL